MNHERSFASSTPVENSATISSEAVTIGTSQPLEDSSNGESAFRDVPVRRINAVVESFRTGAIRKSQATYQIGQILSDDDVEENEPLKFEVLDQYAATLDR